MAKNWTGTGVPVGSTRPGLMVLVSVRDGTSMMCTRLSPAVPTKKLELSELKAPANGAVAVPTRGTVPSVPCAKDGESR